MSGFELVALHDGRLAVGATRLEATLQLTASGLPAGGVDVALRVWTPIEADLALLREVRPGSADLMSAPVHRDDRTSEHRAGRWVDDGERRYALEIALPARPAGDAMRAARLEAVVEDAVVARAQIAVTWTDDEPTGSVTEQPTGPSPVPRHTRAADPSAPCPACGTPAAQGDRFCERCGAPVPG